MDRGAGARRFDFRRFKWLPDVLARIATHGVASAIAFIIITILHITLGELVPKAVALVHPETVSTWVTAPLMGFAWVMAGPITLLYGTANRLLPVCSGWGRPGRD